MTIKLPKEAAKLLDEIERANWPGSTELRVRALGYHIENHEVERLRKLERGKLLTLAQDIFVWCEQLVRLPITARIWEVLGEKAHIMVFWSKYHNGIALTQESDGGHACIKVEKAAESKETLATPILWYEEQRKWHPQVSQQVDDPETLVSTVHPRFLKGFHKLISGPEPWKWVIEDLRKRQPPNND